MSAPHRDAHGRFTRGNPGGPGRKPRATEERYLKTMTEIVDDEAWEAIVKRATQDAINGDAKARAWLTNYMIGQPIARAENTSVPKWAQFMYGLDEYGNPLTQSDGDGEESE